MPSLDLPPDVAHHMQNANLQQAIMVNLRASIAADLMKKILDCNSLPSPPEVPHTRTMRDEPAEPVDVVELARYRVGLAAQLGAYGADELLINLGIMRRLPQGTELTPET